MTNLLLLMVSLSIAVPSAHADQIRIHGSDALGAKLVPQLCELYKTLNPGASFEIKAQGSSRGFAHLFDGVCDIAMSAREIDPEETKLFTERGITLSRFAAATDAFVPVVNASNPLESLTSKQVEAIFTGGATNWSDVGGKAAPISLYLRNSSSASYVEFQRLALNGRPYAKPYRLLGADTVLQKVISDKNGITFIGFSGTRASGIKVLKINGYLPTVADRDVYPYFRNCYYFTRKPASPAVDAFLEWATHSDEALKVRATVGFHPPK